MHDPAKLLPVAYRAAASVAQSKLLAEEAGERAMFKLHLAFLEGCPPTYPAAWLRVVARRAAQALLRSDWGRTQAGIDDDEIAAAPPDQASPRPNLDAVREQVATRLTRRQREAFEAACSCNSTSDAARSCGMQPRDFRRYLGSISRKARAVLGETAS